MKNELGRTIGTGALSLDLRQHNICFVLPEGATIANADVTLPGGALIYGKFTGRIICHEGSLIIPKGSSFAGKAEAQQIYVEGTIRDLPSGEPTTLVGHLLIAVSEHAIGKADLASRAFAIHATNFGGRFRTL